MRRITPLLPILIVCGLFIFLGCGHDTLSGGTSTSENGFVFGKLVTTDGTPASRAEVTLLPSQYDPVRDTINNLSDTTDIYGNYCFSSVPDGNYRIEGLHLDRRTRILIDSVTILDDTFSCKSDTLHNAGSIKILVPEKLSASNSYAYIPGTTAAVHFSSKSKYVMLDSVASGTVPELLCSSANSMVPSVLRYNVKVGPGDTADVFNSEWKYSCRLNLNTTGNGAAVNETVCGFPVLVRLSSANFNFSQAAIDGSDILFAKSDSTPLPFHIERWDAVNHKAEIWVRTDTIKGNRSNFINMFWGNPSAAAQLNGNAVFDTSDGFLAVWHLSESSDTIHDATKKNHHGIRHGNIHKSACMIGFGQTFVDTPGAYIDLGDIENPLNSSLTLSAWVKRAGSGIQTIIAKSNGGKPSVFYGFNLAFGPSNQLHYYSSVKEGQIWGDSGSFYLISSATATVTDTTSWHFVAAVIDRKDSSRCRLYIDNTDASGIPKCSIADIGPLFNSLPMRIGAEADGNYQWTGSIDECTISRSARSEAWLKLCYLNQGPEDMLVQFIR